MKKLIQIITLTLVLLSLAGCGQKKATWESDEDTGKMTVTTYLKRESNIDYVENVEIKFYKKNDSSIFKELREELETEEKKEEFLDTLNTNFGYTDKDIKIKAKKDVISIKTTNGYVNPNLLNAISITDYLTEPITLTSFQEALQDNFKRID